MAGYVRCPKGHYYKAAEFDECPFCKAAETFGSAGEAEKPLSGETVPLSDDGATRLSAPLPPAGGAEHAASATVLIDHSVQKDPESGAFQVIEDTRGFRRMVGWLVSYTINEMGVDFKLFEGRNMIGRDPSCAVCIKDPAASSRHAVILFRSGRYSIMDQQSTTGTFVNDEDIELDPCYLQDGDLVRIGQTVFKFKSSL